MNFEDMKSGNSQTLGYIVSRSCVDAPIILSPYMLLIYLMHLHFFKLISEIYTDYRQLWPKVNYKKQYPQTWNNSLLSLVALKSSIKIMFSNVSHSF